MVFGLHSIMILEFNNELDFMILAKSSSLVYE